jgi:hypothetical protein
MIVVYCPQSAMQLLWFALTFEAEPRLNVI